MYKKNGTSPIRVPGCGEGVEKMRKKKQRYQRFIEWYKKTLPQKPASFHAPS